MINKSITLEYPSVQIKWFLIDGSIVTAMIFNTSSVEMKFSTLNEVIGLTKIDAYSSIRKSLVWSKILEYERIEYFKVDDVSVLIEETLYVLALKLIILFNSFFFIDLFTF